MKDDQGQIATAGDQQPAAAQILEETPSEKGAFGKLRQYDSFWVILAINFGVTGVLGLPLIWYSNKFAKPQKIFWSVVVTIYTCFLIAICATICIWAYRTITNYS